MKKWLVFNDAWGISGRRDFIGGLFILENLSIETTSQIFKENKMFNLNCFVSCILEDQECRELKINAMLSMEPIILINIEQFWTMEVFCCVVFGNRED